MRSERLLLHAHPAPTGCGGHPVGLGAVHQARGPWQSCLQEGAGGEQPVLASEELFWESITFLGGRLIHLGFDGPCPALACLARHPPAAGCFPAVPVTPMCTMAVTGPCCRHPDLYSGALWGWGGSWPPPAAGGARRAHPAVRCPRYGVTLPAHLLLLGVQKKLQKGPRPLNRVWSWGQYFEGKTPPCRTTRPRAAAGSRTAGGGRAHGAAAGP